jgi:hypothetical protein
VGAFGAQGGEGRGLRAGMAGTGAACALSDPGARGGGDRRAGGGMVKQVWTPREAGVDCGAEGRGRRASRHVRGGVPGAGGISGGATRVGVIRGRGEDARRGQNRGRGHGSVVDALGAPLRISREIPR